MFRTKKDVDKHVSDILNKLRNENERNNRGFRFAELYASVREFESAKRYLAGYLSIKERDATGHKLMGKIHEQTGHLEKALQSYKRSLELEENQKDVVLKICELYCDLPVDPERARYWADRAEALFPNHDTVFKLRECIVTADGDQNSQDLEDLIAAELAKRPLDAQLRIKLIKLYLDTERVVEAYDHAVRVESKRPYADCLDWYYCLIDIIEVYLDENGQKITSEFYYNALNAYDRLVYLCLDERGKRNNLSSLNNQITSVVDCAVALHSLDQALYKAYQLPESRDGWWGAFLNHMSGQLYFHLGTFILKRAKKDHGHANMKEACWISAGLFLAAYSFKPTDLHSLWYVKATEAKRKEYMLLYKESCFRLSQTGHMVIGLCKEDRSKWLHKIKQQVCTPQGREKIFQRFCNTPEAAGRTSHFMTDLTFLDFTPEFPDVKTLQDYDENAYLLYPDSLHHVVWLALQYYTTKQKIQPDYRFKIFEGLQFSINNLNTATPESLCQLDVDAFLHATVQTSALALEERNGGVYGSQDAPTYLPVSISIPLCSDQQANWWSAAYRLFKNLAKENLAEMRRILQHGIEVVRVLGLHGIDAMLMVHLAETFAERARELKEQNNNDIWRQLENRAAHYWKTVIAMLEKVSKNQLCRMPKERLFNSPSRDPSIEEVKKLTEEGNFYLACQAMNSSRNEEALEMFETLKTPYASYYQALIFKKLSSEDFDQPRELITSAMRSNHIILLTKSRDALYVTLDRIQGNKKHPLNQVLSYEVEEIETKLARIDPDTAQRHAFDGLSDECVSSQDSEDQDPESPRPLGTPTRKSQTLHSTPHISVRHDSPDQVVQTRHREEHTRPSPERLDAQVRYLTYSQESMFKQMFGEQTKLFTEQTKMFTAMSGQIVEELKEIKIHLEEIGKQIAATNRLRSVSRRSEKVKPPKEVEVSENDDYEYDNYYYEDDETDESTAQFDYHYNAGYKYDPTQNEYPYGNVTGLQGTSTVTYAPPQAGGRGAQRSSYVNYYPNGPQQQPMHPGAAPAHVLPPGHLAYFNPGNISTGLPFSEGQKLPEFNFNPALTNVQTSAKPVANSETVGKQTVFSRLGQSSQADASNPTRFSFGATPVVTITPTSTTTTTTAPTTAFQLQPSIAPNQGISTSNGVGVASTGVTVEAITSITTTTTSKQSATAPHAFQITMPPKSANAASTTFQSIISSPTIEPDFDSKQSSPDGRNRTASGDEEQTEESTGGDFQPVIPLPDEVEVRTGEEDESVLFESRAKLFRFVNKEWKERGIGMLKILFNEKTGRSRILMRRDQVWKICANHFILSDMKLAAMKDNETNWLWAANDFADEKMVMERFCVKFKTAEIAQNFKREFEKAQEKQANATPLVTEVKPHEGFGDRFKPKSGSWTCDACLVNNIANATSCVACLTPRSGPETKPEKTPESKPEPPKSKQTGYIWPETPKGYKSDGFGDRFKPKLGSWACETCLVSNNANAKSCAACQTPKSGPETKLEKAADPKPEPPKSKQTGFVWPETTKGAKTDGFGDRFKPKLGSWTCELCLVTNNANANSCVACSTLKNGLEPKPDEKSADEKSTGFVWPDKGAKLGGFNAIPHKFGTEADAGISKLTPPSDAGGFNLSAKTNDATTWSFGIKQDPAATTPEKAAGFVFGGTKSSDLSGGGFVFGASAVQKSDDLIQYGGFTFRTSPTIKLITEPVEEPVKTSPAKGKEGDLPTAQSKSPKPGLFAQFSFSKPEVAVPKPTELARSLAATDLTKPTPLASETRKDAATAPLLSGLMLKAEGGMSFTTLASTKPDLDKFKADPNFKGFEGSGKSVFKSADASSEDVEAEADLKFEPVVPLPDLVEVKTGEEDDTKLFGERARLYRFDSITQQWKERGIGEMKILKNRTTGAFRILMRREQVHKVCANHRIEAYMELTKLPTSDRAFSWAAKDFSEEVESDETFASRFKTQLLAEKFAQVFQDCVQQVKSKPKEKEPRVESKAETHSEKPDAPLSELFKPKEGSWECVTCMVRNNAKDAKCAACDTARADTVETAKPSEAPASEVFQPKATSWECRNCLIQNKQQDDKCLSCNTNRLSAGADVKLSQPSNVSVAAKSDPSAAPFTFGMTTPTKPAPVFQFGETKEQESIEFKFGTPQNFTFSFSGVRSKSPAKSPKTPEAESAGEGDDSATGGDDDGDHIFFSPIIPLPDKVDVKTGEEDEDTLYCQRAKLYRLDGKEWKERGLGDFKILNHKETGKVRFLMRREFVHKVCLNHHLTDALNFVLKDEKSWLWGAIDFADNEPVKEVFTLRFKSKETAEAFMEAVENAKSILAGATTAVTPSPQASFTGFSFKMDGLTSPSLASFSFGSKFGVSTSPSMSIFGGSLTSTPKKVEKVDVAKEVKEKVDQSDEDSDNLLVLFVKEPTEKQKEMAAELLLPPNFYLYEDLPPCSGCRGCHDEDWSFEGVRERAVVETGNDFEIVKESKAEPERVKQAMDLKLPPNFYLYEKKDPCPGCRGCDECETTEEKSSEQRQMLKDSDSDSKPEPEAPAYLFKDNTGLDFANLAKKDDQLFTTKTSPGFAFGTGNVKVFRTPKDNDESDGEDGATAHQPDIHFEPIVPLPDLVEVKTGEEDEDIIFSQRAKLYRFDVDKKEWKERGVGDAKILKHKKINRYRIILRRDQIYKIACNHSITPDLNLAPLATSETALCWSAMDFAEGETGRPEQFAIKFKNTGLTQQFAEKFRECQKDLRTSRQQLSDSTTGTSICDTSRSSMSDADSLRNDSSSRSEKQPDDTVTVQPEEEDEGDADGDEEDEDADSVMFEKRVSLAASDGLRGQFKRIGMGNLRVLYDDDFYGARVQVMTDDGALVCNHLISIQSTVKVDAKTCMWGAEDYSTDHPMHRQFEASFSSADAAKEFEKTFLEGNEYAKQSDIWDQPYNPAGGDNVGDNGTATTRSNDEVKACSPELAAALSEIIRGPNKSWQFEWDNYGSWEAEDKWNTCKYHEFRAKRDSRRNGTDKCISEYLMQIPSQEMALRISSAYCYAMEQLYISNSPMRPRPNPQPPLVLEGNRAQPDGNVSTIPRPAEVPVRSDNEEFMFPRIVPTPRFIAESSHFRFRPVSVYGHPIPRDSPNDSRDFASICSSDSSVYVDPVEEGRMSRNCRRKSPVRTGRRNVQSAVSFYTVFDSDEDSFSSNEYFFDPVETHSERCLSWLDDMPQFSAKSFTPQPETPGYFPVRTCRHSVVTDGPSICGCCGCHDSKKFYSIVPDTGRWTSDLSTSITNRQMQSSLSQCVCCDAPPQPIVNTRLPFTAKTVNTQYLSPEIGDSINTSYWSQPSSCTFNSFNTQTCAGPCCAGPCFAGPCFAGSIPVEQNEAVDYSHSKRTRSPACSLTGRSFSPEEIVAKQSSDGPGISASPRQVSCSCSPINQFIPLNLEMEMERSDFLRSSPENSSEGSLSDEPPLVIVSGTRPEDRFVMHCRECRQQLGLMSDRINSQKRIERIDRSTSVSPAWKALQRLRKSAGGSSPYKSRASTTESGCFVTSRHSPQPILVRLLDEPAFGSQSVLLQVMDDKKTNVQATNTSPESLMMRICPGNTPICCLDSAIQCGDDIFHDPFEATAEMMCTLAQASATDLSCQTDRQIETKSVAVQCVVVDSSCVGEIADATGCPICSRMEYPQTSCQSSTRKQFFREAASSTAAAPCPPCNCYFCLMNSLTSTDCPMCAATAQQYQLCQCTLCQSLASISCHKQFGELTPQSIASGLFSRMPEESSYQPAPFPRLPAEPLKRPHCQPTPVSFSQPTPVPFSQPTPVPFPELLEAPPCQPTTVIFSPPPEGPLCRLTPVAFCQHAPVPFCRQTPVLFLRPPAMLPCQSTPATFPQPPETPSCQPNPPVQPPCQPTPESFPQPPEASSYQLTSLLFPQSPVAPSSQPTAVLFPQTTATPPCPLTPLPFSQPTPVPFSQQPEAPSCHQTLQPPVQQPPCQSTPVQFLQAPVQPTPCPPTPVLIPQRTASPPCPSTPLPIPQRTASPPCPPTALPIPQRTASPPCPPSPVLIPRRTAFPSLPFSPPGKKTRIKRDAPSPCENKKILVDAFTQVDKSEPEKQNVEIQCVEVSVESGFCTRACSPFVFVTQSDSDEQDGTPPHTREASPNTVCDSNQFDDEQLQFTPIAQPQPQKYSYQDAGLYLRTDVGNDGTWDLGAPGICPRLKRTIDLPSHHPPSWSLGKFVRSAMSNLIPNRSPNRSPTPSPEACCRSEMTNSTHYNSPYCDPRDDQVNVSPRKRKYRGQNERKKLGAESSSSSEYLTVSEDNEPSFRGEDDFLRFIISLYHSLPDTSGRDKLHAGQDKDFSSVSSNIRRKKGKMKKRKTVAKERNSRTANKSNCCSLGFSGMSESDRDDYNTSSDGCKCKKKERRGNCRGFLNRAVTPNPSTHRKRCMTVLTPRMSASWGGLNTIFDSLASTSKKSEADRGQQRPKYSYTGRDAEEYHCRRSNSEADTGYASIFPMTSPSMETTEHAKSNDNKQKSKKRRKCRYCLLDSPTSCSS